MALKLFSIVFFQSLMHDRCLCLSGTTHSVHLVIKREETEFSQILFLSWFLSNLQLLINQTIIPKCGIDAKHIYATNGPVLNYQNLLESVIF